MYRGGTGAGHIHHLFVLVVLMILTPAYIHCLFCEK